MSDRLGVDLGATWLRACLARDGRLAWEERRPAVNWRVAPELLRSLLKRRGLRRVDELTLGGTGLGAAADRRRLARALRALTPRPRVLTDFELAHLASFRGGHGVILGAGTGSFAYARGPAGARRAGGFGPLLGDEGSGFWLGREASRDARLRDALGLPSPLTLAHAQNPVRATASLARKVLAAAARNPRARVLRERAADELAVLAKEAERAAGLRTPLPLALHGSLFADAALRRSVLRRLSGARVAAPAVPADRAAAGLLA